MSAKKNPFKRVNVSNHQEVDLETLFRDLKSRSSDIRDLYASQADILRSYHNDFSEFSDVSLELPTGTGKTLVGLLIAEWRRKFRQERVLYLCPTKQLAYQVGNHSKDYGIKTHVFVGSKRDYPRKELYEYRSNNIIAISTYSGLFNIKPGIDDPQTIILDDAHSAHSYISSNWSLTINRHDEAEVFSEILCIFEKDLPQNFVNSIHKYEGGQSYSKTEKIPLGSVYRHLSVLREVLESARNKTKNPNIIFPWLNIQEGLQACHIYISTTEISIRPYIPPTLTHKPFAGANQRVYMSATLGRGGELERITGIRGIKRIPTPKTFISRGVGRRFFMFPDLSKDQTDYSSWLAEKLLSTDRTLVLCPNNVVTRKFLDIANSCYPKLNVLTAKDIEEDLTPFTESTHSLLLLTNRYDGIDLPHGICKQVIIDDLPSRTNLQETFLEDRLGLDFLFRERIKTRIEQASGRCTRSDTDNAAIIMLGKRLLDFCIRNENQELFHPELRAEIQFSLKQDNTPNELDKMLDSFLKKDENWKEFAEESIAGLRSTKMTFDTKITDMLANVVKDEVDFTYALWAGDFESAIKYGKKVIDGLSGNDVAAYRALWYFFTAGSAYIQSKDNKDFENVVSDLISRAKSVCKTVSWFPNEMKFMLPNSEMKKESVELNAIQVEEMVNVLNNLGSTGPGFTKRIEKVENLLKSTDSKKFDKGVAMLGELLGFASSNPKGSATPDCYWKLGHDILFLFEGKSDESPENGISVQNCRQTSGHLNWAKSKKELKDIENAYCILLTPKFTVDEDALPHADNINFFSISDIIKMFQKTKTALIEARTIMITISTNELKTKLLQKITEMDLTVEKLRELFTTTTIFDLPKSQQANNKNN